MKNSLIRIILAFFGLFFLSSVVLTAQDKENLLHTYRPGVAVKFVPLPLFAYIPAIQLAVEF